MSREESPKSPVTAVAPDDGDEELDSTSERSVAADSEAEDPAATSETPSDSSSESTTTAKQDSLSAGSGTHSPNQHNVGSGVLTGPAERSQNIGYGLWFAGLSLWSYVVVGEYVVGAGLPEHLGWSLFAGVLVGGFLHGANRLGLARMVRVAAAGHASLIVGLAFIVSAMGTSRRSEYQAISVVLLLAAAGLVFYGLRHARGSAMWTGAQVASSGAQPGARKWLQLFVWIVFGGNTLLIVAALLSQI